MVMAVMFKWLILAWLTRTVPVLEAYVRDVVLLNGHGQSNGLHPAWSVVVVNDHRTVFGGRVRSRRTPYTVRDHVTLVIEDDNRYFNVLASRLATFFELALLQGQVQIVPHVPRHYHVRKTHFLRGWHVFERQRIFLAHLPQVTIQYPQWYYNTVVGVAGQRTVLAVLFPDQCVVQLTKVLFVRLEHAKCELPLITAVAVVRSEHFADV